MTFRRLPEVVLCCAISVSIGCGGSSSSKNTIATSAPNVQPIAVNSGPNGNFVNGAFTSVMVCAPGSSNCQTISGVLVDTGSFGLRILSSALSISLPQQNATDGNPIAECVPFANSYTWGPVQTADVHLSGETASAVPIQVLSDTAFPLPTACKNLGLPPANSLTTLGANGILGVGEFVQDCGPACTVGGGPNLYYECPSSGCTTVAEALAAQVQNPVGLFATDNNGVIVELPAVNVSAPTLTGSLVFGIGTQSNNGLGGATVYAVNQNADITTQFGTQQYADSFLDSGSNGIFFLDTATTGLPDCSSGDGFYCPTGTQNLKATNLGSNGASGQVSFSIADADSLFNNGDSAYSQIGGPNPGAFDWGLPFFYGRNVFTAINGQSTPQGVGPYWAY
jgi:Protein of unknown function (DUF3443)